MLRLSKLTDYGTVILSCMAEAPERTYSAAEVAGVIGVGVATASKILKLLMRQELVQSVRGARGGYVLARAPGDISIAEVLEAMEGPFGMTVCSIGTGLCASEKGCRVRENWQRVNQILRQTLNGVSLADMAAPGFSPGGGSKSHHGRTVQRQTAGR